MATLLKADADIFAVGVTNQTDDTFLANMSSGGVQNVNWFHSTSFEGLQEIRDQVVQQACIAAPTVSTPTTTTPDSLSTSN